MHFYSRILFLGLFCFASKEFVKAQALTTSLTACYGLDGNGAEYMSSSTGTLSSVTSTVDRNNNASSALYFSGSTSSYVDLPDNQNVKPSYITFSAWVKSTSLGDAYIVFTKNTNTGSSIDAYSLKTVSVTGGYVFRVSAMASVVSASCESTTTLTANTWYHVAFTQGSTNMKIYVNGQYESSASNISGFVYQASKHVILGGTNETANAPFTGIIDNVKFHNRELTAGEISLLYNNDFSCIPTPPPSCNGEFYTINTSSATVNVSSASSPGTGTVSTLQLPWGAQCLAVGPSFSFTAPNPTYWTVVSGVYWYFNGKGFYSSGDNCGTTVTSHVGGSKNFLYNYDPGTNKIYKYNGTSGTTTLAAPGLSLNYVSQDVVGDEKDNYYLLKTDSPQSLNVYNSSGSLTCSYPVSGIPSNNSGFGFAVVNNTIVVHNTFYYVGVITPSGITFTQTTFNFPLPGDFANCYLPVASFTADISASPSPSVSCFNPTITLIANSATPLLTYTWSGPAISGSVNSASASVTSAGVYTCSMRSCAGGTSIATYTVLTDSYQLIPVAVASNTIDCYSPYTQLSVTPNSSTNNVSWSGPGIVGATNGSTITAGIAGIYTVAVSNTLNACAGTTTINVVGAASPLSLSVSPTSTLVCSSAAMVTLTAGGADSYIWSPSALVSPSVGNVVTVNPQSTTTYSLLGSRGVCTGNSVMTISVMPTPTLVNLVGTPTVCLNGSAYLSVNGANNYTWTPGNFSGSGITVSPAVNTSYTVNGEANGCSSSTIVSVVSLSTITNITLSPGASSSSICIGNSVNLNVSGATSYTWQPVGLGGASVSVSPSVSTIYTVNGSDNNGCFNTATINIDVESPITNVTASSSSVCSGNTVTLNVTGAGSYTWLPGGSTGSSFTDNPPSTRIYTVTGTSVNSCLASRTIQVSVVSYPVLNVTANPLSICEGETSLLTATGASNYTWSTGPTSSSISVNPTTTSIYTLTGANGACVSTTLTFVNVNPKPVILISSSSSSICSSASATLSAIGAHSYTWLPANQSGSVTFVSPLASTVYSLIGSYTSTGCYDTKTIAISVIATPTLATFMSTTTSCSGNTVMLGASGASSYTWTPGSVFTASTTVSPTVSATYTISGANSSCISSNTLLLQVNANPTLSAFTSTSSNNICAGQTATLTSAGALNYTWMPGSATGSNITVAPIISTIYTLTGMAANNCIATKTILLGVYMTPTVYASATPTGVCNGGTVSLSAYGLYVTNSYWNPYVPTGGVITPTATGVYTVYAQNGNPGTCSSTNTVLVTVYSSSNVVASPASSLYCYGYPVTLTATGANNYTWNPGGMTGNTTTVSPNISTTYTVTGDNGSTGCVTTSTLHVGILPTPVLSVTASQYTVCTGTQVNLSTTGANNYTWSAPAFGISNTSTVYPTSTTIYTVLGGNFVGCVGTGTVKISVDAMPAISLSTPTTQICSGSTLTMQVNGAVSYVWQPGGILTPTAIINPTASTVYTITAVNGLCSSYTTIAIAVSPNPTLNINAPGHLCTGNSATLTVSGANSYLWLPSSNTSSAEIVSPSVNSTYTLSGAYPTGCSSIKIFSIQVDPTPSISVSSTQSVICSGHSSTLTAQGATTYSWLPINQSGSQVIVSPVANTVYTLIGTSSASCSNTNSFQLGVNPSPSMTTSISNQTSCAGQQLTLTATGANSYLWLPGNSSGSMIVVAPNVSTTYTVQGSIGVCNSESIVATNVEAMNLNISPSTNSVCSGETISLTASGALSYLWDTNDNTSSITFLANLTDTYSVKGTSQSGCTDSTSFVLTVSDCVGLSENKTEEKNIIIYPNPNNGEFAIGLTDYVEGLSAVIYNPLGQKLQEIEINGQTTDIKIRDLRNGIYELIFLKNNAAVYRTKIVKQ